MTADIVEQLRFGTAANRKESIMTAWRKWHTPFDDENYEKWAADCGCEFVKLERCLRGGFWLHLRGTPEALDAFENDISEKAA